MNTRSIVFGVLGALGLGGVALAMGNKKESVNSKPITGSTDSNMYVLTYGTSRPITDTDLTMIQRALSGLQGAPGMTIQGIAIGSNPQEFKANVYLQAGSSIPGIGSVGVLGSNANDAITIQLIAADKV